MLIKFRLASFRPSKINETVAEYSLLSDNVLLILRYPRYVCHVQSKFGHVAALIIEELLRAGSDTASNLILKSASNSEEKDKKVLVEHRDKLLELIDKNYLVRSEVCKVQTVNPAETIPIVNSSQVPSLMKDLGTLYLHPEIDVKQLISAFEGQPFQKYKDASVFWHINFERFHQDFRDSILISTIERRIDANAGECLRYLVQLMYTKTDPWQASSNPISFHEIKSTCEKNSKNAELTRFIDQYIQVIESDSLQILAKTNEVGTGQYILQQRASFEQLAWCCIENVVQEKFGAKALRIFRVIRLKKYIEQDEIQKEVMVPSKEAKHVTYKLISEKFIQMAVIKKPGGGGTGPAKSFFMFFVDQVQLVYMLIEMCYKALFNSITRANFDASQNQRIIEKSQRLEGIAEAMKERGEPEEYIEEVRKFLL